MKGFGGVSWGVQSRGSDRNQIQHISSLSRGY